MFTSITDVTESEIVEQVPRSSPPWVWVGFLFAGAIFVVAVALVIAGWEESELRIPITLIGLPGMIYWFFCIHRIHKILGELTSGRYPITPNEAALKHIIPFYNLFWIFRWPTEFSDYLNRRGRVSIISGSVIGVMLLLSMLVRLFDTAIGMAMLFGVTMFVSSKLKKHVKAVRGVTPDQLPPLPDPRIFSRPIETSTSPVPETVEGSGAR